MGYVRGCVEMMENMRKKRTVVIAIACVAAVAAAFAGPALVKVYAQSYQVEDVELSGTVLNEGDVLVYPEWGNQGMSVRFLDASGRVVANLSSNQGEDYTIPPFDSIGDDGSLVSEGGEFMGWKVQVKPTRDPMELRWDLEMCVQNGDSEKTVVDKRGANRLQSGTNYSLGGDLSRVQGDATVYSNPIEFTVERDGLYIFH